MSDDQVAFVDVLAGWDSYLNHVEDRLTVYDNAHHRAVRGTVTTEQLRDYLGGDPVGAFDEAYDAAVSYHQSFIVDHTLGGTVQLDREESEVNRYFQILEERADRIRDQLTSIYGEQDEDAKDKDLPVTKDSWDRIFSMNDAAYDFDD